MERYIILKAEIKDKIYVLINIYAPNKDKDSFKLFADLLARLKNENFDEEEENITGVFNCPLNTILHKKGGILTPRKSVVSIINSIQGDLDLVDIWRVKNPNTKSYRWSQNSPMILCRLDYWLISNNLHDLTTPTDIIPAIKTDHSTISLELNNNGNQIKGPRIWKMNCALLEDDRYVDDIKSKIPVWLAERYNRNIWDWLKYNIRAHAIQHSKRRAKERIEKENHLEEKYSKAKMEFERDPNNLHVNILNSAKEDLELFYKEKKVLLFAQEPAGMSMVRKERNIFSL